MHTKFLFALLGFLVLITSCQNEPLSSSDQASMKDLAVPDGFCYKTTKKVQIDIWVQNTNTALLNVPVGIFLDNPGSLESPHADARFLGVFASGKDGRISIIESIPSIEDSIYLRTNYIGLESVVGVPILGNSVTYHYGQDEPTCLEPLTNPVNNPFKSGLVFTFMGTYTNKGVPTYLVKPGDIVLQDFLNDVNTALPESKSVLDVHPEYLAEGNETDIVCKETADVWITFVHEGASYLNTLGYYVYDVDNPPKTIADISSLKVIFPNVSYTGSGGGLKSGDKVFLGRFEAGKAIGWFLVSDGWKRNSVSGNTVFFSEPKFNPESDANRRQHTLLLYDSKTSRMLLGFEDMDRTSHADNDFNDVLFYVTANPIQAIDISRMPSMGGVEDQDKDGISDQLDEYPNDPTLAFNSYYPAKAAYGSLLVEDLWPDYGDFDFNDLVVDYNFIFAKNAENQVKKMTIQLRTKAIGASFSNGFGIQLPFVPSLVESVTGAEVKGDYVTLSENGVESGQSKAVIIAFENAFDVLPYTGTGTGVNVVPGNGWTEPATQTITVTFVTPQSPVIFGQAPFNPFLIVNGNRGKEIHLGGQEPTDLVDLAYFGQGQDDSNSQTGKFYQSVGNLVWMMDVPSSFQYMVEKHDITKAYLKLGAWVESGGLMYTDWYLDLAGYRETANLYYK